jgi:hypothetical protein
VSNLVRTGAVKLVKPLVSDSTWARLRSLGAPSIRRPASVTKRIKPPLTQQQERRQRLKAMNLTELAQHFGTDKYGVHRYTPHYERHLGHLRSRAFTMLEIGVGGYSREGKGGASLRMWKHFFPKAQILGLDIQDKSFVDAPRIKTIQGSQVDEELLVQIVKEHGPLEVIVDDGSHRPEHIRETFRILFPLLADGGIYAIEDTQTSYWPTWGGSEALDDPTRTMGLVKSLLDGLNYEEWADEAYEPTYSDLHVVAVHAYHNLVILEKGENREGTNRRRTPRATAAEPATSESEAPAQESPAPSDAPA